MKKRLKRFLSLFLAVIMMLSVFSSGILTADAALIRFSHTLNINQYRTSGKLVGNATIKADEGIRFNNTQTGTITFPSNAKLKLKLSQNDGFYNVTKIYFLLRYSENRIYLNFIDNRKGAESSKLSYPIVADVKFDGSWNEKHADRITKIYNLRTTALGSSLYDSIENNVYFDVDLITASGKKEAANYSDVSSTNYIENSSYAGNVKYTGSGVVNGISSYVKNYNVGRYRINTTALNVRYGAGISYPTIGSLPYGTVVAVTKISNGWGYMTSASGVNGWISLYYCSYDGPNIIKPPAPSISLKTSTDINVGGQMTIEWNSVTDAKYYTAALYDSSGNQISSYSNIYGNSATFMTETPGTYSFKVTGHNSVYTGDTGECSQKVTVHGDSTVTFCDEDGTVINTQKVHYNGNASAPSAPAKRGYTFKNWSGSLYNIKQDTTVTAQYEMNEYAVQFIDNSGNLIDNEQKVKYGESATPPAVTTAPENYEFVGWSSQDYLNVYKVDKTEPIKVYAVYAWKNKNLPVACTITSASRQTDGYYINFDVENYPDDVTRGRAVLCLKTAQGKLVDMTESTAFSIPAGATKSLEVFLPCNQAATTAEIIIVDSYSSGVPISNRASTENIEQAKMWSDWKPEYPNVDESDSEIESRQEFRFRNAKTMTSTTASSIDGWTQTGRTASVGSWTGWSDSAVSAVNNDLLLREVNTRRVDVYSSKTKYNYYHYHSYSNGLNNSYQYNSTYQYHSISLDWALSWKSTGSTGINWYGTYSCPNCSAANYWIPNGTGSESYVSGQKTQWQYRDTRYTYSFMRFNDADWSEWGTSKVEPTNTRQVENRTTYRYKSVSAGVEDNSGEVRNFSGRLDGKTEEKDVYTYYRYYDRPILSTISKPEYSSTYSKYDEVSLENELEPSGKTTMLNDGTEIQVYRYKKSATTNDWYFKEHTTKTVSEFAGKQITLYIYRVDGASDYTNEYIGQTTVNEDGSYSFDYILREEPSEKTGDLTIAIAVEGATAMQIVGTIEAPKPKHKVTYYDADGSILSEQQVVDGESAVVPETNPEKLGSTFVCWNNTCTNVKSDMEVKPVFVENVYTVVFVDWRTQEVRTEQYHYGDPLIAEEFEDCESGNAVGWDVVVENQQKAVSTYANEGENVETEGVYVTSDMVVSAVYDTKTYNVNFYDNEGNVVDSQTVEYDGVAEMPELPETDGVEYIDWDIDIEDLMNIKTDIAVVPEFVFDETTANPTASVTTGAYDSQQTVSLNCEDENALIYYTLDGSDPSENPEAILYSEPFTVSDTSTLRFFAMSFNKNSSDIVSEYYVIGNNGKIVTVYDTLNDNEAYTFIVNSISDINNDDFDINEGYTFDGFYTDKNCTVKASTKDTDYSPIVELYAKYSINTYTVSFYESENSTSPIKDVQAEYGTSVTPPDMPDTDGKVFVEWQGGDYAFVYGDTEVYAVYKYPSEIVTIDFDKTNFTVEQGVDFRINANVSDDSLELIWISEDENVAIVSDDGTVTAVGAGETTVYAVTEDDSAIAKCVVTVGKSPNYSICLRDGSSLAIDSQGYLRKLPIDETNTVSYVTSQLRNNANSLTYNSISGTKLSSDSLVGTGTVISLSNGGKVLDNMTVVLTGDLTGDGIVSNKDVSYAARISVKKQTASDAQLVAMDVNGDGKVNNRDVAMLSRYLVGKETIKQ